MVEDVILGAVDTYANAEMLPEEWDLERPRSPRSTRSTRRTLIKDGTSPTTSTQELREIVLRDVHEAYAAKEAELGRGDDAPRGASRDAERARRRLARSPLRDGLPARGHRPARDGTARPARRVPARRVTSSSRACSGASATTSRATSSTCRPSQDDERASRRQSPLRYTAPQTTSDDAGAETRQPAAAVHRRQPTVPAAAGRAPPPAAGCRPGPARRSSYETIKREGDKVGRNDPCPCGSGKKYKRVTG